MAGGYTEDVGAGGFQYTGGGGGAGGVPFDVGVAIPTGDLRAVLFNNGAGALDTERDTGAIGATGVVLDRFKIAEHIADTVFAGHFDHCGSATDYQLRFDADGDTFIKAPGAGAALTLIAGDSGVSTISLLINAATTRFSCNNTGIGFFGVAPTARSTGWTAFTNPAVVKTCDTATVTLPVLAQLVGTLQAELVAKGLLSV